MIEALRLFAQHQFKLGAVQKDGTRLIDHLNVAKERGRYVPELDDQPKCPPLGAHVWLWYADLGISRQSSGMGPLAFRPSDILAWATGSGVRLRRWEFRALRLVDNDYLVAHATAQQ